MFSARSKVLHPCVPYPQTIGVRVKSVGLPQLRFRTYANIKTCDYPAIARLVGYLSALYRQTLRSTEKHTGAAQHEKYRVVGSELVHARRLLMKQIMYAGTRACGVNPGCKVNELRETNTCANDCAAPPLHPSGSTTPMVLHLDDFASAATWALQQQTENSSDRTTSISKGVLVIICNRIKIYGGEHFTLRLRKLLRTPCRNSNRFSKFKVTKCASEARVRWCITSNVMIFEYPPPPKEEMSMVLLALGTRKAAKIALSSTNNSTTSTNNPLTSTLNPVTSTELQALCRHFIAR